MSYRDLLKASITSLVLFALWPSNSILASDIDTETNTETHWAEEVEGRSIDLSDEQSESLDASAEIRKISKHVQQLKTDVVDLNTDLRLMEEQLLFPSSTKYSVFVSLSSGQFFVLESVKLKLDGKLVATHIYSENQRQAMLRGGIHRMYVTNLSEGKHTATAFFTGVGPGGREYKRAANIEFEKGANGKYLELAIGDDATKQEPTFAMTQW